MAKSIGQSALSWIFIGAMFLLCGVLGVLQYRWIGDVSATERERLRQSLEADLNRLSQEFNSTFTAACRALLTPTASPADLSARYLNWKSTSRHAQMFNAVGLAVPVDHDAKLYVIDVSSGEARQTGWPDDWQTIHDRIKTRLSVNRWQGPSPMAFSASDAHLLELPIFQTRTNPVRSTPVRPELGWMVLDLNTAYVASALLPDLIQRHVGTAGGVGNYLVDVVTRTRPSTVIYQSSPDAVKEIEGYRDASAGIFDIQFDKLYPRPEAPGGTAWPGGRVADTGKWQINVRNRAGSLEAVVSSTRRRNLAVTGAILLLLVASAGALLRYTRRAERLARLQMDFVAGISHELRTPLAVIYGAAYNLRGSVAQNPSQVERYGAVLQQESGRLRDLVEQVLQFSGAQAGRVIRDLEPLAVEDLIDQALESSRNVVQSAQCTVEKRVDPALPIILGDPVALKHALQNLVSNAAKYGQNGGNHWIGLSAAQATGGKLGPTVEIRVADRGPGIPADEQDHVFDAFFRGRRAVQDQIHGTGLGLNLVKKIVEAHGGDIRVESEPMKRTEFIVRLPVAPVSGARG